MEDKELVNRQIDIKFEDDNCEQLLNKVLLLIGLADLPDRVN